MSLYLMRFEPTSATLTTHLQGSSSLLRQASTCSFGFFLNGEGAYHSTQLMVNTAEWGKVHAYSSSASYMQSTGVVVVHVNKGDEVLIKTLDSRFELWNCN